MKKPTRKVLEQLIEGSGEPVIVAQVDHPDWPVILANPAFLAMNSERPVIDKALADVIDKIAGRTLALEISETIRGGNESSIAVELGHREYLLVLKPLRTALIGPPEFYAVYWRLVSGVAQGADQQVQEALLKARRRICDLSRDDPITGLLNGRTFSEVLAHDWAVASREKASLALLSFTLDDFAAYLEVFGRHAADSCLRRVSQAIRRCLRRASDVAARIESEEGDHLVVLSHSSDEKSVDDFAKRIAAAVRELGLHHPRSREARFVTVSYQILVTSAGAGKATPEKCLQKVMQRD